MRSTRSVYGGYKLAKPASQISLLEIIEADAPKRLAAITLTDLRVAKVA